MAQKWNSRFLFIEIIAWERNYLKWFGILKGELPLCPPNLLKWKLQWGNPICGGYETRQMDSLFIL